MDGPAGSVGAVPVLPAVRPARIGIAFGAGAARGWAHIGVVQRLAEAGIHPDVVSGTSIGALVGGFLAAGRLDALEAFARSLTRRRLFSFLDVAWGGSGLFSGDRLASLLDNELADLAFEDLSLPFICIATELLTGHEIWLRSGRLAPALRASYALPGVFRPIELNRQWLIDGAVVNPIPVSACRALGARLLIAVNLNSDAFAGTVIQRPPDPVADEIEAVDSPAPRTTPLRQLVGRKGDPGLSTVLLAAFNISQDRLARSRLAGDPPDITIVPRTNGIGLFEFDRAGDAIAAGREAAERALPDIAASLETLRNLDQP